VDTEYAPCACAPLGKLKRTSMPHAPGVTPIWTTHTYDGSGRTLTTTLPDGSVTTYLYEGNTTKITDAAGKWKKQTTDAMGNLVTVTEPNPAGGADHLTNYTYDVLNHLTGVSMPRNGNTQTRTFVYTGNNLTSETNPESGTKTYQYMGTGRSRSGRTPRGRRRAISTMRTAGCRRCSIGGGWRFAIRIAVTCNCKSYRVSVWIISMTSTPWRGRT
jgi:YD repeat-containing protein